MDFKNFRLNILISTGIYPPKIGGPAQYGKNLKTEFEKMGHTVKVETYLTEDKLPSGVRHLFFFFKIIPQVINSDIVFILDTFSVGLPTVLACQLFGKKSIIRTGGDFLWEQYVERTGKMVLLRNFYEQEKNNFNLKEKIIFSLTRLTLLNATRIIFSTEWQRDIFVKAYGLEAGKTSIVENYYGPKEEGFSLGSKIFVASARELKLKNMDILEEVFNKIKQSKPEVELFARRLPFSDLMEEIKHCYAVIQVSLGDISPNLILDSIRCNKPFICTKETGIFPRIKDAGIFVDPLNEEEIEQAVLNLLNHDEYKKAKEKIKQFSFVHTWENIAEEFLGIVIKLKVIK
jgi:glycosyltransferase involved in cell wall biosynthesis